MTKCLTTEDFAWRIFNGWRFSQWTKLLQIKTSLVASLSNQGAWHDIIQFIWGNHVKIQRISQKCWITRGIAYIWNAWGTLHWSQASAKAIELLVRASNIRWCQHHSSITCLRKLLEKVRTIRIAKSRGSPITSSVKYTRILISEVDKLPHTKGHIPSATTLTTMSGKDFPHSANADMVKKKLRINDTR